ncbi:MAG: hypothetical protein COV99_11805 [Bacteroidetes bacterium CG12_big_fil_rev_8_21_14_0_65_60_17]|nr:MAG: hypothetical protein COV99_11805 [Bacteroidetes bacterium CG12_big_fil_rev_8_21_14_0_65_60_17]
MSAHPKHPAHPSPGKHTGPPRLAERIVGRSLAPPIRDAALGDFHQMHAHLLETEGRRAADAWYWRQALRSVPHLLTDTVSWTLIMLANYLRVAYRNLLKNRSATIINVTGLSISVATAVFVFFFVEAELTRDRFHAGGETVLQVMSVVDRGDHQELNGMSPMPLGPAMRASIPQVEQAGRMTWGRVTAGAAGETFDESNWYADPAFMEMLSFPMAHGEPARLEEPDAIVLSHAMSEKYFGDANPVGESMTLYFPDGRELAFNVVAVADPFPSKASFLFNAIIPFTHMASDAAAWDVRTGATFIRVAHPADVEAVAAKMDGFREQQVAADPDRPVEYFRFVGLYDLATTASTVTNSLAGGSPAAARILFSVVALFMLLLSCINYITISVGAASRRLREIGVRKTMGGTRSQIVWQFLAENTLVCGLSLGLGILLAYAWFVPGFNAMFAAQGGGVTPADAEATNLWIFLTLLFVVITVASGLWPALRVSRFSPVAIFKGRTVLGGGGKMTYGFLTFQFVLAFLTMIMGVVLAQNAEFVMERDWGYDAEQKLVVPLRTDGAFRQLATEIEDIPGVERVVGANNHFWSSWQSTTVHVGDGRMGAVRFDVGEGFVDLYGLELVAGSSFPDGAHTALDGSVLVNELFASRRDWTPGEAVGQTVRQDTLSLTILGVVKNIQYDDFYSPLEPAILAQLPGQDFRYMTIQLAPGSAVAAEKAVKAAWHTLWPDRAWEGFFQDTVFDRILQENRNIRSLFGFVSVLALLISCMGLYGIVTQRIAARRREISIRKVLGATLASLASEMNRTFVIIVAVAAVLATPLGYVAMEGLLSSIYADPMPLGPSAFVLSLTFVLGTALVTIASQFRRIARMNPADELRGD